MILNNFIEVLLCQGLIGTNIRGAIPRGKRIDGKSNNNYGQVAMNDHYTNFESIRANPSSYSAGYCLAFGSSDIPASADDYAWDHNISGLSSISWSVNTVIVNGAKKLRITETVMNDTEEDVVVKEIGLIVTLLGNVFLVAREVLAKPITIKANGGVQVLGIDLG